MRDDMEEIENECPIHVDGPYCEDCTEKALSKILAWVIWDYATADESEYPIPDSLLPLPLFEENTCALTS
jgi:hypothetical protein